MSDLSTDIAIEFINVNKNFQDFIAVNNVNLQIRSKFLYKYQCLYIALTATLTQ
jgi:hypothetical protein